MAEYKRLTADEALMGSVGAQGSYTAADTKTYHAGDGTDDASNVYTGFAVIRTIQFITASVLDSGTSRLGGAVNTSETYPAGFLLKGVYDAVQLASGSAEIYGG